jgi:hypothetical protein
MDRNSRKRMRNRIGERIDVSRTRLSAVEAVPRRSSDSTMTTTKKGRAVTHRICLDGWGSEGKDRVTEANTDTLTDEVGIRRDYVYRNDHGPSRQSTSEFKDARGVLNCLQRNNPMPARTAPSSHAR